MFTNLFCRYLISKNIITEDDFFAIQMAQNKTKVKLGLIAVSEKMMTEQQAEKINRKQQRLDKRFGDIAIEMGLLTNTQVERLLALQGNPYLQFCQCVCDNGILTLMQIEEAMESFKQENGFTNGDMDAFKSGDIDRILPLYLPSLPSGPLIDLLAVTFRCLIRLVSTDICINRGYVTSNYKAKGAMATQEMYGDYNAFTSFSGDDSGILALAEAFAKEFFDVVDINALDSVGEFINIADGLFITAKSYEGMEINLKPPIFTKDAVEINGSAIYVIPIEVNQESLDLLVRL